MTKHFAALFLIGLMWADTVPAQDDWTGWLGPQRDGIARGVELPDSLPDELNERWSIDVGTGYGSPLLVGDHVFQHARQNDAEVLWCIRVDSGDVVWKQSTPVPFKIGNGGEWHGKGPKASPAYADGRVFTHSITSVLSSFDASSGRQLWQRDLTKDFSAPYPYWGASASPVVAEGLVILHLGGDDDGALFAFNAETGETVWRSGTEGASYSSPLIATIDGTEQVVQWNHQSLVGVRLTDGQPLWSYPFPHVGSDQNMPTPTIIGSTIFLSGENRGAHGLSIEHDGEFWSAKSVWHQDDVALNMSSAIAYEGNVYGFSQYDRGRLFCLDPASGEVRWTGPPRTGDNVMLLAADSHIVALLDTGKLVIAEATPDDYREVKRYDVSDQPTWAPPVLLSDGVLVKDKETLKRLAW
ncbi:PQQ-binding-like beta-propeller repeat protein [Crateriforma conspicua]|uniref:Outer membrane biogenesis protein BamB n=1 Tax=Crateriforma conspicua TaxID=2527996 RepID=A0A5C5XYF2_9PLAN|nr:PQQ-binding-like beta-propeller repeat protein [Crateriforma conspicua]TWT68010.1 outer membrane biogenesis protein BamB [Crateriforma conspicua]